ncbi:hypothetical protein NDU88_005984, partial [Pleurodeles waltl]
SFLNCVSDAVSLSLRGGVFHVRAARQEKDLPPALLFRILGMAARASWEELS